jgi:hypothetical protein
MAISLLGRPCVHGFKVWRARRTQWHIPSAPMWLLSFDSWTLMLDSISCVVGPECFMLGALPQSPPPKKNIKAYPQLYK